MEVFKLFYSIKRALVKLHQTCSAPCIYQTILELSEYSGISCFLQSCDNKVLRVSVSLHNFVLPTGVSKSLMKYLLTLQSAKRVIFKAPVGRMRFCKHKGWELLTFNLFDISSSSACSVFLSWLPVVEIPCVYLSFLIRMSC